MPAKPIFQGIVEFRARIVDPGKGLTFPLFEFDPNEPGVDRVEIEGQKDNEIRSVVYLSAVATSEDGIAIATKVHTAALDQICFLYDLAIEDGRVTRESFSPINGPPGSVITPATGTLLWSTGPVKVSHSISRDDLKRKLENPAPPGERNFSHFRSALQSTSSVEEFMHLYNLLLMFFDDDRRGAHQRLDEFIRGEQPGVASTPHPRRPSVSETLYTRLRNELAHNRQGVNLDHTKAEMRKHLAELISLVKRAIELHS